MYLKKKKKLHSQQKSKRLFQSGQSECMQCMQTPTGPFVTLPKHVRSPHVCKRVLPSSPSGPNHMLLRVTALLSMNSAQNWVKGWRRCIAGALSSPGAGARRTFSRFNLHQVYMQGGTHTWFCPQILTKVSTIIKKPQHNKGTICWCGHTHPMCGSSPQDSIPVCHPAVETPPKRFVFISRARLKILGRLRHQA